MNIDFRKSRLPRFGAAAALTCSLSLLSLAFSASARAQTVPVVVNTSGLTSGETYYLDYQVIDANQVGDGNSTVTLTGFQLTNGTLGSELVPLGTPQGSLDGPSGLVLTDNNTNPSDFGTTDYTQGFTVDGGASDFSFDVILNGLMSDTDGDDTFDFFLLDSSFDPLGLGPLGEVASSNIDSNGTAGLTVYGTSVPPKDPLPGAVPELSGMTTMALATLALAALAGLSLLRRSRSVELNTPDRAQAEL